MSETCKKGKTSEKFGIPKSGGMGFEPETSGFGVRGDNHRTITPEVRSWPRRFGTGSAGFGVGSEVRSCSDWSRKHRACGLEPGM